MRYLYVLLLLSLAALLWAAWAISRHIRRHSNQTGEDQYALELSGLALRDEVGHGAEIAVHPIPVKDEVNPGKSFEK